MRRRALCGFAFGRVSTYVLTAAAEDFSTRAARLFLQRSLLTSLDRRRDATILGQRRRPVPVSFRAQLCSSGPFEKIPAELIPVVRN